jgi:hypothetical protein
VEEARECRDCDTNERTWRNAIEPLVFYRFRFENTVW